MPLKPSEVDAVMSEEISVESVPESEGQVLEVRSEDFVADDVGDWGEDLVAFEEGG